MWVFGGWIFCRVEGFIFGTSLRFVWMEICGFFPFASLEGQDDDILRRALTIAEAKGWQ
jgi:hypothetical protein